MSTPTPKEFMERVVVWPGPDDPGYINLHWLGPEAKSYGFRGAPFRDIHEFMNMAGYATGKPGIYKEIFFCLSTQRRLGKVYNGKASAARNRNDAMLLKALWLDVDVGKENAYQSLGEALIGIDTFRRAAGLPPPSALVFSGGGIHVYWISDKPLTPTQWLPYAEGLKAEALRLGLKSDAAVIADVARVLRVPGTNNNKLSTPRPVVLKHLGDSYDFAVALPHLAVIGAARAAVTGAVTIPTPTSIPAPPPFDLSKFTVPSPLFAGLDPHGDKLADGVGKDDRPLDPTLVFKNCKHYRTSMRTGGTGQNQGLWHLSVLGTTWMENGRDFAHAISKDHPGYSKDETDAMFDRKLKDRDSGNLGWPSCAAFESEGAKCKTCPLYQKVRSPLNVAERVKVPGRIAHAAPLPPEELELPPGYTVDSTTGWICEIVHKKKSGGEITEEVVPLFMSKLRNFVAQAGTRRLMFDTSLDFGEWGPASVSELDLTTDQSLIRALRRDGVMPYVPNQGRIAHFMTSFMSRLDNAKRRIQTLPFGWLRAPDGGDLIGFAYGNRVVLKGGTEQKAGYADHALEAMYTPKGSKLPWYEALHVVTAQKYAALEVMIASSFAAPLMIFTGQYNGVMNPWSDQSGAHKSTSLHIGAAVWGSPKRTKERPTASQKGLLHKLGAIKNLPLYVDEVNSHEKMDQVREMIGDATEGGTGSKLKQDRSFYEQDEWQTMMVVGANVSLSDNILRNSRTTDAGLQRVFEFRVDPRPDTADQNKTATLISSLDDNYGHVGLEYSKVLGSDPDGIRAFVSGVIDKFNAQVKHSSPERFRSAMACTCYAGAALANKHLGTDFNLELIWDFLVEQYQNQTNAIKDADIVAGTVNNTANAVTQFFKSCVRNALWVKSVPSGRPGRPPAASYVAGPNAGRPDQVHIRLAIDDRTIEFSRQRFHDFLVFAKSDPGSVLTGLRKNFGATTHDRVDLASGSGVLGGREAIVRIPVPDDSPFINDLFVHRGEDRPFGATSVFDEVAAPKNPAVTAAVIAAKDLALVQQASGA